MLDERGRDIWDPKVSVRYVPATPELVAQTRAGIKRAVENMLYARDGYRSEVEILWGEKPAGYGIDHESTRTMTMEDVYWLYPQRKTNHT